MEDLETIRERFAKNLRRLRKERGFDTQDALAEAMDIAKRTVASWEVAERFPRDTEIDKLCELLKVDVGQLFQGEGEHLDWKRRRELLARVFTANQDQLRRLLRFFELEQEGAGQADAQTLQERQQRRKKS